MATNDARIDEELEAERAHLSMAEACLQVMRSRAEATLAQATRDAHLDTAFDHAAISAVLHQRLVSLQRGTGALAFGRIDNDDAEVFYVGRRHVEDDERNAVIVDWRASVSAPFYRATWVDPLGLTLRRRFAVDGETLAGFFDENFNDPNASAEGGGVPDPLLAELDRARSGAMRDIVATIQAEQDEIIRAPLDDLIVVQGGPGTGKTAVGLHRAAFLLYEHRELFRRTPLLVIGPNPLFLAYIAEVLPSLGETSVTQTTIELLLRKHRLGHVDADDVARLKGDGRMATVIDNAIRRRLGATIAPLEVTTAFGVARLAEDEVLSQTDDVLGRRLPTNTARDVLREQLVAASWNSFSARTNADPSHHVGFVDGLRSSKGFKSFLDKLWPNLSAPAVIRSLLTSRPSLAAAAAGILSSSEQALLHRSVPAAVSAQRWSRAELALLDEADEIIGGVPRTFAHVVVDEAQDLSAMELRVAARRSPNRSLTILGDLAQSTSAGGQHDWDGALDALRHSSGRGPAGRVAELTLGYRVPAPILDVANRVLPFAAPGIRPARSVREAGTAPTFVTVDSVDAAIATAVQLAFAATGASCAVLADDALLDGLAAALSQHGGVFVDGRRTGAMLAGGVTLLSAVAAKGLEFDNVIVVEPNLILRGDEGTGRGARVLYVAMTRAVQSLTVLTSEPVNVLDHEHTNVGLASTPDEQRSFQ
jgi:DNA helicase IV